MSIRLANTSPLTQSLQQNELGYNQQRILRFISERGGEVNFAEIVAKFETQYYTNAGHYVGLSLSSMVKNGFVQRVRKGVYSVGAGGKTAKTQEPNNQSTLF